MKKKISILILTTLSLCLLQSCCTKTITYSERISIYDYYQMQFDSLSSQTNDFVTYYLRGIGQFYHYEVIYTLIEKDSSIIVTKYDNISKSKLISELTYSKKVFGTIKSKAIIEKAKAILEKVFVMKPYYPINSIPDGYEIKLRIKNFEYDYSYQFTNDENQLVNYLKILLFNVEAENEYHHFN